MKKIIYSIALSTLFFWGCATEEKTDNNVVYGEIVGNIAENIIVKNYNDLNTSADVLNNSIIEFKNTPTETNLINVKEAWKKSRQMWEQTESFLFGPVDQDGIDPALDTWPVDVELIAKLLENEDDITVDVLAENEEARGFHSIEYLVWGNNGIKKTEDFTEKELQFLSVAAEDMKNNTQRLSDLWAEGSGNYVNNFTAFNENSVYPNAHAAIEEIVESIIDLLDELVNGKIGDPLNIDGEMAKTELEESRFSNNSQNDFINNFKGIQNLLSGKYQAEGGKGLNTFIESKDKVLSEKVNSSVAEMIADLENINLQENESIFMHREELKLVVEKTKNLFNLFEKNVAPLFTINEQM